jgi:hypothetical protein
MDRYFAALPVGKIVKRANWSINTTGPLFLLEGNHMTPAEVHAAAEAEKHIDLEKTVLRCERQTLHRLPDTGALVFAFKVRVAVWFVWAGVTILMDHRLINIRSRSCEMKGVERCSLKLLTV